tara:strand:+ start:2298 stop:2474 length:177 start_codon:yes stop_codon:yes gene_type:complete
MKIIKIILGIEACIAGLLIILYLLGTLAYMGMELDMMAYDYEYHEYLHSNEMNNEDES